MRSQFVRNVLLIFVSVLLALPPVVMSQNKAPAKAASNVKVLGNFSSIKHTPDHAYGYALQLWREGQHVFGLLLVYTSAPFDPPIGMLEDVKFDPGTGKLSFSARLSTGLMYSREYSGVPSRDRFKFEGVLTRRRVIGNLTRSDDLFPNQRPTKERIRLRWSQSMTEVMIPAPATYAAWKTWADESLRRTGPRW